MLLRTCLLLLLASTAAHAGLRPQAQIDGGLSVIGAGYEHPLSSHVALQGELFVFGTYFLPWFDLGDDSKGFGFGIRPTWFARETGHGLYVTPFFRGVAVDGDSFSPTGIGFESGVFVGWAFSLSNKLDLRLGGGAQYIHFHIDDANGTDQSSSTPFVALDATLGWRL
jgi:hypothetical protein